MIIGRIKGGDIWLIGVGKINTLLLNAGLIDELILFIIPVLFGEAIPLFREIHSMAKLNVSKTKTYSNGVVEINYTFNHA